MGGKGSGKETRNSEEEGGRGTGSSDMGRGEIKVKLWRKQEM